MPENLGPAPISVADIVRQIRSDVARRKKPGGARLSMPRRAAASQTAAAFGGTYSATLADFPGPAPIEMRREYDVHELLARHDEAFVRDVYRAVLQREADDDHLAGYVLALRQQRINKVELIQAIVGSSEGRASTVRIAGLTRLVRRNRISRLFKDRLRIVRYFFRWLVSLAGLPRLRAVLEGLELTMHAYQTENERAINTALTQVQEQLHARISANEARLLALDQQFAALRTGAPPASSPKE